MNHANQLLAPCGIRSLFEVLKAITMGPAAVNELNVQRESDRMNSPLQRLAMHFNRARDRQERYEAAQAADALCVYYAANLESALTILYSKHAPMSHLSGEVKFPSLDIAKEYCPLAAPNIEARTMLRIVVDLRSVEGWSHLGQPDRAPEDPNHILNTTSLRENVIDLTLIVRRPSGELEEAPIPIGDAVIM